MDLCVGDDRTGDSDGDGVCDDLDPCPFDAPPHDVDGDGVCNAWDFCDGHDASGDADGDGVCDDLDDCFGTGPDTDGDGICDDRDPCPLDAAGDSDLDGSCDADDLCIGDDRDGDRDGDGVCDGLDACLGDDFSGDTDLDGICDDRDPCAGASNVDTDGDGVCDEWDVCPDTPLLPRPCEPAPEGLVHFWPGDGHLRDVVGGADAAFTGSATFTQPGRVHRGFQLTVPTTSSIRLPPEALDGVEDFTFALWVRSGDVGYGLVSAAGAASANAFLIFPQDVVTEVHLFSGEANVRRVPVALNDLAWHHFAVTREKDGAGPTSQMRAYLDGALVDTWSVPDGPIDVQSLLLGQEQDGTYPNFTLDANQAMQGRLDEVAIYRRALDGSEVARLTAPDGICEADEDARDGGDDPLCSSRWYVDPEAPPSGDGRSFATAFTTLLEAEIAAPGDTVWVRAGTPIALDVTVTPASDTTWIGGFQGHETDPDQRVDRTLVNAGGVAFGLGATSWVTLDGFAFEATDAGYRAVEGIGSVRIQGCDFGGFAPATGNGGAVLGFTVAVQGSSFDGNASIGYGGAISTTSRLFVRDTHFTANEADHGGAVGLAQTGAVATIRDSHFTANAAVTHGGAVYQASQRLVIEDGHFQDNAAGSMGGAVYGNGPLVVDGSTFLGNTATAGAAALRATTVDVVGARFHENGGDLISASALLQVSNAEFVDNGSGYLLASGSAGCNVWSATFTGNATADAYFLCDSATLRDVVFIGNAPAAHGATCASCCAPGGTVEAGASTLVRVAGSPLDAIYLPPDSPCRDAGTVEVANAAPLLDDFWWRTLTTTEDQSLDGDPPDMGYHAVPLD